MDRKAINSNTKQLDPRDIAAIKYFDEVYIPNKAVKLSQAQCDEISTDDVTVLAAYISFDITSLYYGKLVLLTVTPDNQIRKFYFGIYDPNLHGPHLSNEMKWHDIVKPSTMIKDCFYTMPDETGYGKRAYWDYTPMSYLEQNGDESDVIMRKFLNNIKAYSRKMDYCRKFRNIERRKATIQFRTNYNIKPDTAMI